MRGRNGSPTAYFRGVPLEFGGIYYVEYGTDAVIETRLGDFYLISLPLTGMAAVSIDRSQFTETPDCGTLLQPGQYMQLKVGAETRHLVIRLERATVHEAFRKTLGHALDKPVIFDPRLRLDEPKTRVFYNIAMALVDALGSSECDADVPVREFGNLLVAQLLRAQANNYIDEVQHGAREPRPNYLDRAVALIEARAYEPLTVEDIAAAVDTTSRTLQNGFRRAYGTSPMAFLREVRLQRVHKMLAEGNPDDMTVTAAAMHWGFHHLGRFSGIYQRRFGQSPSFTLGNSGQDPRQP